MPVVGCSNVDRVEVFFFLKQLSKIAISTTAFIGSRAGFLTRAVICFDQPFCRFAPTHTEAGTKFACELDLSGRGEIFAPIFVTGSEQAARGVQQSIGAVLA